MANIKAAIKSNKKDIKRRERNRSYKAAMRTYVKKVKAAVEEKDKAKAEKALIEATMVIDKVKSKGVIHQKNASRKISRLTKLINRTFKVQ